MFHEALKCLHKLAKDNFKPRDPTFCTEHERVKEDRFWPNFKGAIGAIYRRFTSSSGSASRGSG